MENNDKQEEIVGISIPRTPTSDLRDKQSVRATFKLTKGCIDTISIVAAHLGIKQKSLFDHLIEDTRSLKSIAHEIQNAKSTKQGRIQKTFVISRRSLSLLDKVSKYFNAPRDTLVEYSVQRLLPIIAKEREKHDKRKEMLAEIEGHLNKGLELLKKMKDSLGVEDPIYQKIESAVKVYESTYNNIEFFIEKGKIIEDFKPNYLE